jgi:hypothetical protein
MDAEAACDVEGSHFWDASEKVNSRSIEPDLEEFPTSD